MGTTMVFATIDEQESLFLGIGDSIFYQYSMLRIPRLLWVFDFAFSIEDFPECFTLEKPDCSAKAINCRVVDNHDRFKPCVAIEFNRNEVDRWLDSASLDSETNADANLLLLGRTIDPGDTHTFRIDRKRKMVLYE
ncbi:hypothetical protein SH449x_005116 [Pirellulaceae bacterium SH449]